MTFKEKKKTLVTVFKLSVATAAIVEVVTFNNSNSKKGTKKLKAFFKKYLSKIQRCRDEVQLEKVMGEANTEMINMQTPQPKPEFASGGYITPYKKGDKLFTVKNDNE